MLASVVVLVVHPVGIATVEREGDPPIAAHGDGPRALPRALQFMQIQAGEAHVARPGGYTQATQDQPQSVGVPGLDTGLASGGEEPLQTFVPKGLDRHRISVTRNASRYNPHNTALHPTGAGQLVSAGG